MRPKIVVLDGYTLCPTEQGTIGNPESHGPHATGEPLNWHRLEAIGDVTVYDRSSEQQAIDRAKDTAIVLTNKTPLSAKSISQLPALRYIGVLATGVNVVDLEAAHQHQIVVTNVPGYSTDSVAQHVFAILLELTSRTSLHDQAVHAGQWSRSSDFSMNVSPITELAGKTLGIVGLGAIGRRVAKIGSALGMHVAAAARPGRGTVNIPNVAVRWLPLDELAKVADVLTLHCPLTEQTRHLINAPRLKTMKPSAILINTGRGALVDEAALAAALHQQQIAGAGLDVVETEPPKTDNPLLSAPHCVITPHVAWASVEAKQRLMNSIVENVKAFLNGQPINVVTAANRPTAPPPPPEKHIAPKTKPAPASTRPSDHQTTKTILLLAAIEDELKVTIDRLGLKQDGDIYTGQLGSTRLVAAVLGVGATRAKTATTQLVDNFAPDAVILIGFAGGLDPHLAAGTVLPITWVIDERGWAIHLDHDVDTDPNQPYALATVQMSEQQRQAIEHSLVTLNHLVDTVAAKRQLFDHYRCAAVDMETYPIANLLAERGIPLAIRRAISDPADMALPAVAIDWIKPDGRANVPAVLRHLLIHPWCMITMMRLAKNTKLAAHQLADHVERMIRQ